MWLSNLVFIASLLSSYFNSPLSSILFSPPKLLILSFVLFSFRAIAKPQLSSIYKISLLLLHIMIIYIYIYTSCAVVWIQLIVSSRVQIFYTLARLLFQFYCFLRSLRVLCELLKLFRLLELSPLSFILNKISILGCLDNKRQFAYNQQIIRPL